MPMTGRCSEPNCHAMVVRPLHYCSKHSDKEVAYQERQEQYKNTRRYSEYNKRRREYSDVKVEQNRFYQSKQWKSLRDIVRRRDNFLCVYCLSHGRVRTGRYVDHIIPVEYDVAVKSDLNNLAFCCSKCHAAKTKWEQLYYGTGFKNTIKSVVPIKNVKDCPDFQLIK